MEGVGVKWGGGERAQGKGEGGWEAKRKGSREG